MAPDVRSARPRLRLLVALLVILAFAAIYRSTMLPGVDLGDTPSFQTMGGSAYISPRDAYPLYFALSAPAVWWAGDPAAGMNLASVVFAALASGLVVLAGAELAGGTLAGVLAGLLSAIVFGASFTFWSQAVIAEVYALHILCVIAVLLAALAWERDQRPSRLAVLLLLYAVSFGNHLTMIVLLPGLLLFLLMAADGGPRSLLTTRVVALALVCALIGASQYAWNIRTLLIDPAAPSSLLDALRWFWFDVTKQDWRDTMVLELPGNMASERARMFLFDLHQQFGWWSVAMGCAGAWHLARHEPRRLALLLAWWGATLVFALTYNVGDTHVFLLPAHLVVALLVAPSLTWALSHATAAVSRANAVTALITAAALVAACLRLYDEYPALDRSEDRRAPALFSALTADLGPGRALLLGDLDWQLGNGLNYYAAHVRTDLAFTTLSETLPYAPTLLADNLAIGREVVLTGPARSRLDAAYGRAFSTEPDPRITLAALPDRARGLRAGTPYVMTWVKAARDPVTGAFGDDGEGDEALAVLTGGRETRLPPGDYAVVAGLVGDAPRLSLGSQRPFTRHVRLADVPVQIRMDAWMAFDTIRRMGFGQVIANRRHALIVERGVSLVGLDGSGAPLVTAYAAGLYAPQPRYRLVDGE